MIFSPAYGKLLRSLRPQPVAAVATQSWTIAPAEETASPAAIYFEEELARVTGYSAHSSSYQELGRLTPHTTSTRATMAYEFKNVMLCGGNLYAGPYKYLMRDKRQALALISQEVADGGVPCSSWLGGMYFGHWLADDTALKLLAEPFGQPTEIDFQQTDHQRDYNDLFEIDRQVLPDACAIRKITIVDSELFSSFRDQGWAKMTARVRARYPAKPHIGCMLLRGASGLKRVLVNESEVAERLRSLGFRVIDPAHSTLDEILSAVSGSRIIVGVEGSQLSHGFFGIGEGDAMLVLQPPNRFGCIDKERCDRRGIRYAFSIGYPEPEGFRIDLDSLMRVLARVIVELRPYSAAGLP